MPRRPARADASPAEKKLETYRAKRRFDRTPEPAGGTALDPAGRLSFVVQKHAARRLHYDFRLELDGVLLSWAVPKGPSLDPAQKRLAARTEDHPIEYGDFEGIIPQGEYGGGSVIVWDRGTWEPEGDARADLARGRLSFALSGEKLRGRWHLVRTRGSQRGGEEWLLFKSRDDEADAARDVTAEDRSVLSGRTVEEVAAAPDRVWHSNRPAAAAKARPIAVPTRAAAAAAAPAPAAADLSALIAALPAELPRSVPLTNLDKVLFPEQGLTKGALVAYYAAVAERMVEQIARRPLTLVRCPEGHHKQCFFQKHVKPGTPAPIRHVPIREESGQVKQYMAIEDLDGLLGLVQLGVLEIHTWGCRSDKVDRPDQLVFDLDPDEDLPWQEVVSAALELRRLLDRIDLASFPKTTGGKGLHVVVPIQRRASWDEVKEFTQRVALAMTAARPERYLAVMSKRQRKGKIFVDYLRNSFGASAIAPYSTRARPGAPVAAPLTWEELERGVAPSDFTVLTMPRRLAELRRDPWADYAATRQALSASMLRAVTAPAGRARRGGA